MMRRVVVFAAHPDDAEIAAGGTLALLAEEGHEVTVVHMTTSEFSPEAAARRREAAARAAAILGHRLLWFADGQHQQVEELPEYLLVREVDALFAQLRPEIVFSHWIGDSHGDHVRLGRVVNAASRCVSADLYAFPPAEMRTPGYAAFSPNVFVDVGAVLERKLRAITEYNYEGQGHRRLDPAQYEALAAAAGAQCGCRAAEAFLLLRHRGIGTAACGAPR